MERFLRIGLITAGVALLVSAMVGLISGVTLGTVVTRALAAAVIFGAGGVAMVVLIDRMLPELAQTGRTSRGGSSNREPEERSRPGSNLNIVVESAAGDDAYDDDDDSLVEEVVEQHLDDGEDTATDDEEVGEGDWTEGGADGARDKQPAASYDGADDHGTEDMPDIGSFAGSFVSHENGDQDEVDDMSGASDLSKTDNGNNTAQMARALRTVLSRDE